MRLAALSAVLALAAIAIVLRHWRSSGVRAHWSTYLVLLAVAVLFTGCFLIVLRGADLTPRDGDLQVYLRAAWAAQQGESLYAVTDPRGLHYIYPPLLASLLVPFAEPPPDAAPAAAGVPYGVAISLWYWLCVACVLTAVHLIASALERLISGGPPSRYSQGWWNHRLLPLLVVLLFVLDDLRRAQPTAIILLCLAGSAAAILRRRSGTAGAWLGVAAALKLFPAYLLLLPLWRRDGRFLAAAFAVVLAASLLPVAIIGPSAALNAYREFVSERLLGEASGTGDPAVASELHRPGSSTQGFEFLLYDALHPAPMTRTRQVPPGYFAAHIAISLVLTAAALLVMRRRSNPLGDYMFFSALALLSIPILPVSRPHYFMLGLLAVAGLTVARPEADATPWDRRRDVVVLAAFFAASILDGARIAWALDFGVATLTGLLLAALALAQARASTIGKLEIRP